MVSRLTRVTKSYVDKAAVRLTRRDKELILTIYEHRFLTTEQIEKLFFSSLRTAQMRLKALYEMSFLDRIKLLRLPKEGDSSYVYCLAEAGAYLISFLKGVKRKDLHWRRRKNQVEMMFLEHTLTVNQIYVELKNLESKNEKVKLLEWVPDREIKARFFRGIGKVRPDAYLKLGLYEEEVEDFIDFDYFLEVDLGTMRPKSFSQKIKRYIDLDTSDERKIWFDMFPTILIVTTTKNRLEILKKTTEETLKENYSSLRCFLTTLRKIEEDLSGKIWQKTFEEDKRYTLIL